MEIKDALGSRDSPSRFKFSSTAHGNIEKVGKNYLKIKNCVHFISVVQYVYQLILFLKKTHHKQKDKGVKFSFLCIF